jgi:hypothetical protein
MDVPMGAGGQSERREQKNAHAQPSSAVLAIHVHLLKLFLWCHFFLRGRPHSGRPSGYTVQPVGQMGQRSRLAGTKVLLLRGSLALAFYFGAQ